MMSGPSFCCKPDPTFIGAGTFESGACPVGPVQAELMPNENTIKVIMATIDVFRISGLFFSFIF